MSSLQNGTGVDANSTGATIPLSDNFPLVETDLLIVGAGPAGASLACFLASYGLTGTIISKTSSTSDTPRAHLMNPAALECLRDIGLEEECNKVATGQECLMHTRWCYSMAGEEYGRIYSWGNDPKRKGGYTEASPCHHIDLPQTLLEPILVRRATSNGFKIRFDTTFVSFVEDDSTDTVITTVRDNVTNQSYRIKSKYLFGADGARGEILKQLGIGLIKEPGQGLAINVLVKADLSHLIDTRMGNLHWILQPDVKHPEWGWTAIVRMVKPWHEWLLIIFPSPGAGTEFQPSREEYLKRVKEFIGDDTPVDILGVSKWYINEIVAEEYSKGNVFCLGDAVHRHPPMNGLGSNTCIQDAFNLAWKIAYVMKGKASRSLLDSYNIERQPVGQTIVTRANQALRDHIHVWNSLGILNPTPEARIASFAEISAPTAAGQARRADLRAAITSTAKEFHGIGVEMNQRYPPTSSAIYTADSPSLEVTAQLASQSHENEDNDGKHPETRRGMLTDAEIFTYVPNTKPGSRLPHMWLLPAPTPSIPVGKMVSTIDLAGHGIFTLFTGLTGRQRWEDAAKAVSDVVGVEVKTVCIGWRQEYEDVYFGWEGVIGGEDGIGEDGAVLVRPDRFVAWRGKGGDERVRLERAMRGILGL